MRRSVRGTVAVGTSAVLLVGGLVGSTTVASADPSPTPTPTYKQVTLSPEESQRLCAEKLPKLIEQRDEGTRRLNRLRRPEFDQAFPGLLAATIDRAD